MALNAALSVADGNAAASSVANGASVLVTPTNLLTVSVTTPGTLTSWQLRVQNADYLLLNGAQFFSTTTTSTTILMPATPCTFQLVSEVSDGTNVAVATALVTSTNLVAMKCRNVVTSLAANSGTTTGTLTASSNGAWASQDGVTNAVGDVVFIQGGTTNLAAAGDAGPYVIQSLGGASAKWVITRPGWFPHVGVCPVAQVIDMGGEGTLWGGTSWKSFATVGSAVIDTNDLKFYVGRVTQNVALVASTTTLSNVGIRSATASLITAQFVVAGGTTTSTVGYGIIAAPTAGYIGTASAVVDALASAMGKNGTADTSTVAITVVNW